MNKNRFNGPSIGVSCSGQLPSAVAEVMDTTPWRREVLPSTVIAPYRQQLLEFPRPSRVPTRSEKAPISKTFRRPRHSPRMPTPGPENYTRRGEMRSKHFFENVSLMTSLSGNQLNTQCCRQLATTQGGGKGEVPTSNRFREAFHFAPRPRRAHWPVDRTAQDRFRVVVVGVGRTAVDRPDVGRLFHLGHCLSPTDCQCRCRWQALQPTLPLQATMGHAA